MHRVRAVPRVLLTLTLGVLMLLVGLAAPASATVIWANEQEMIDEPLRSSYIFDVGAGNTISNEQFAAPDVVAFYRAHQFDTNFMYWAPIIPIDPPAEYWNACSGNTGGLCQHVVPGQQLISAEIGSGQIHVKHWNGAFIGAACGNWNRAGAGPVPEIRGVKYEDRNGDGTRQPDEPGLAGWTITLSYQGSPVDTRTTGADGSYTFPLDADHMAIRAGSYTLAETPQPGWVQSQAPGPVSVAYGVGAAVFGGNDFGNYRPATISGRKFDDRGVDGSSAGDPGLPGWGIALNGGAPTTTGPDGGFAFSGLRPGNYTVAEQQQAGWRQTTPGSGTTTVTVTSGQVLSGVEFGNVCLGSIAVTAPATVAVKVEEVSVPGILSNEPALPRLASGTSAVTGLLPGSYRVTLTLPDGVFTTDPDLTSVGGEFVIVKMVNVTECATTAVAPVFVTSAPGKITGGVRISVPGGFATAGFEFMQRTDSPRGTLEYNDHASDVRIHTSDITGISVSGADAYIFGHATIGTATSSFRLHLVDAGEPGTADRFELLLSSGYSAGTGQTIDDGNVQMH
jgi:SdrD B-like domain